MAEESNSIALISKKTCVIVGLFSIVYYKVVLCDNNEDIVNDAIKCCSGESYNIDGTKNPLYFGMVCTSVSHDFISGKADEVLAIRHRDYSEKLTLLMNTMLITYNTMTRIISSLEKQKFLEQSIEYFQKLIGYQKNDETAGCLFLLQLSKYDYNLDDSFNENMKRMLNANSEDKVHIRTAEILSEQLGGDFDEFIKNLKIGYAKFISIIKK